MARLHLTLIFILLLNSFSFGQAKRTYVFSGTVSDTSNSPLVGASIIIPELRIGTTTNESGHFKIANIPPGTYLVNVTFTGYHPVVQNIQIDRDLQFNFQSSPSVTEEKEVVIISSLPTTSITRNPIPIVRISKSFLSQSLSSNAVSAIGEVPGLSVVTTGPNVAKPFIRGLGFNRVLTLFDGIRQEGQQWGNEHGVEIDANDVDHIEVIKGPASLLYGSDAIAGVINFIPSPPPPTGTKRGKASLQYGSNNNLIDGSINLEGNNGTFNWNLIGSHQMAMDYRNKIDGPVYNTGFRQSSLFFQSAIHKKRGYSRIGLSYFDDVQEIPDGSRDSTTRKFLKENADGQMAIVPKNELYQYKISDQYQRIRHVRAYNISNFSAGSGRVETQLGFQKNIREEFDDPGSSDPSLHMDLNTFTYSAKYFSKQIGRGKITTGFNGMYQINIADKGSEFLIPNYHQLDFGPFIYSTFSIGKTEWAGGLGYDVRNYKNQELFIQEKNGVETPVYGNDTLGAQQLFSNYKHTFAGFSGSIGMTHRFNKQWNLKLNIARGFRAPNIAEISANGIHAGDKIYQLGNENFKPEFSFQQDIGVNFESQHVSATASIFNNDIRNYIFNQKLLSASGADSTIVEGFETFQYTASRANLHGGELSIDIHPHPLDWLHFENSLSMVFAKNLGYKGQIIHNDEQYLPFIVPIHGQSELRGSFKKWKPFKNPYIKFQAEIYARQNRIYSFNETETPTAGYQLFNIGMGGEITDKNGKTIVIVNLMANNIFNKAYQSHLSRLKYFEDYPNDPRGHHGIYNMGSNVSIKVTVPFGL